jgi:hypothetical protein
MSSRTDPLSGRLPLAAGAAMCAFALGCSATGNQFLGTVMFDKATQADASPAGSEAGGACTATGRGRLEEVTSNLDIYFTVDSSQQSFNPDQWDTFASGFNRFLHLDSANGIGMGIGYFPAQSPEACGGRCQPGDCGCLMACGCDCEPRFDPRSCQQRSPCDASTYQRPAVDIAPLPQNNGPLAASLFTQNLFGQRFIHPALQGSLDHLASFEGSHPDQRVVEVLIVGGQPSSDCQPGSIGDCADVADGSNAKTFVVAFDTADSPFDPIAARGGTERASRFDANRIEDQFVTLVNTIRRAPYCEYALPDGVDYHNINVELTAVADASINRIFAVSRVRDRGSCENVTLGWFYDRTRIVACDETCKKIREGMQPSVNVCDPTSP